MLHKACFSLELRVTVSPRVLPLGFMGIIHQFLWCVGAQALIWGCLSALPRHSMQTSPPWHLPLPPSTLPGQAGAMPPALIFPTSTCGFPLSTPLPGGGWRLGPPLRGPHCPPPPSTGLLPLIGLFIRAFAYLILILTNLGPMTGPTILKQKRINFSVFHHCAVSSLLSKLMKAEALTD